MRLNTFPILLLTASLVVLACGMSPGETPLPPVDMPHGLEGVRLGMTIEELSAVRPHLNRDHFGTYIEATDTVEGNELFSFVSFDFTGNRLTRIVLSQTGTPEQVSERCSGLVAGSIAKWGEPAERSIGVVPNHPITHASHEYPLLQWHLPGATIVENCISTVNVRNAPNFYTLALIDPKLSPDKAWKATTRPARDPSEFGRLFAPMLERSPHGPLFH